MSATPAAKPASGPGRLDVIIPVYNEGDNIVAVLESLAAHVRTPCRVLLCYDHDADTTLPAARGFVSPRLPVVPVKNQGRGAHGAVTTGFRFSTAAAVIVFPADDTCNAPILDRMVAKFDEGNDLVAASRFMPGGRMAGCPWLKALLVRLAAFTLNHVARVPTHDATNGFRLFSRRVLDTLAIESTEGFTYSLELLVKCHRLGWRIAEVPAQWLERQRGRSRFRVLKWLPHYLRWYGYAFATTFLRRGGATVPRRSPGVGPDPAGPARGAPAKSNR